MLSFSVCWLIFEILACYNLFKIYATSSICVCADLQASCPGRHLIQSFQLLIPEFNLIVCRYGTVFDIVQFVCSYFSVWIIKKDPEVSARPEIFGEGSSRFFPSRLWSSESSGCWWVIWHCTPYQIVSPGITWDWPTWGFITDPLGIT